MQLTNVFGVILEVCTSCIKTRMSFRVPEQKQYQGNAVINSIQFNSILYYASVSELFMVYNVYLGFFDKQGCTYTDE